jgi:hypothetical protein
MAKSKSLLRITVYTWLSCIDLLIIIILFLFFLDLILNLNMTHIIIKCITFLLIMIKIYILL